MLLERSGWKVLAAPKAKPNYEVEKMFDEDINIGDNRTHPQSAPGT